jgi:hypothetical protein
MSKNVYLKKNIFTMAFYASTLGLLNGNLVIADCIVVYSDKSNQGILMEEEGSVRLTSLYY